MTHEVARRLLEALEDCATEMYLAEQQLGNNVATDFIEARARAEQLVAKYAEEVSE